MVSKNPNPTKGFYLDPNGIALPIFGASSHPANMVRAASTTSSSEDLTKKIRKTYTITKSRESWTEPEHDKFLEALQLFDRDWKKIESFIGSKNVIQIRSHAQKYFLKVQKNGTSEHLPPPRPKRKSAHPYPQKALKTDKVPTQSSVLPLLEQGHDRDHDSSAILRTPTSSSPPLTWANKTAPTISLPETTKVLNMATNCCSSTDSTPSTLPICEPIDQMHTTTGHMLRVLPDFAQVYRFIGSIFDPNSSGQQQKLKKMDAIDVETVLLLVRNLSINLASPDFEDHKKLLSTFEMETDSKSNQWQCK